jgi:uncharacterized protein YprB with RNaseH-like and TPR domain
MSAASIDEFLKRRPLCLDIETTGLKADYGLVLVIGVREFTPRGRPQPVRQFVIDNSCLDMESAEYVMLLNFRTFMAGRGDGPDDIITFNGSRFDVPYLQARLAAQGLPLLPKMRHLDLFFTIKNTFKYTITSRRAKYIQALFRVGDPEAPLKDSSEMMTWLRATFGRDKKAFARIIRHNREECLVSLLYQARRLMPLMPRTVSLK